MYLLMEFVPGEDLHKDLKRRGCLAGDHARFYLAETVVALEALYARQIIYRDLKPENIMLARDGHIKLIDFGFARQLSDIKRERLTTNCGTPTYTAPEVLMG